MSDTEKNYSKAYEVLVCADSRTIYGVQLTLKMHRTPYEGGDELVEEFHLKGLLDEIDA